MSDPKTLDELNVLSFVRHWFRLINDHAPAEELLALLAVDDFELRFPEASLTDAPAFITWYRGVTHQFFDQVHDVKQILVIDSSGEGIALAIWVNWQAKTWEAPAANSTALNFDAFQRWLLVMGPDEKPRIKRYIVEQLTKN